MLVDVLPLASCCVGFQFINFPGAHGVVFSNEGDAFMELLRATVNGGFTRSIHFGVAFVNSTQNGLLSSIFEALGWQAHQARDNIVCYLSPNFREYFTGHGFGHYRKSNLRAIPSGPSMSADAKEFYRKENAKIQALIDEGRPARKKFYSEVQKRFGVTKKQIQALSFMDYGD